MQPCSNCSFSEDELVNGECLACRRATPTIKAMLGQLGRLPQYSLVGCYTILYARDDKVFCAECALKALRDPEKEAKEWPNDCGTYDEGDPLDCCNCDKEIESSYGPVDD